MLLLITKRNALPEKEERNIIQPTLPWQSRPHKQAKTRLCVNFQRRSPLCRQNYLFRFRFESIIIQIEKNVNRFLLRAEYAVARIAQAGQNIAVFVKAAVERGDIHVYVGMSFGNFFHPLGSAYYIHEFNGFASALF